MDWPNWLTFRPIEVWPGEKTPELSRVRSPFSAPFSTTVDLLRRELSALDSIDGSDVLQVALTGRDLRLDGKPRVGARPAHPGVILAFSRAATSKVFSGKGAARGFLRQVGQVPEEASTPTDETLFKLAARHAHPDHGGQHETWLKVVEANRLLTADDAYQFAVDRFRTWEDNLRAIALTMESLRRVERYGAVKRNEQYTGWKQLTTGRAS